MSLVEVMLAAGTLLLLLGMIIEILIPAGNMLAEGSTKTELQQLAQLSVNQMVYELGQTPPTGVSLVSPANPATDPMILVTHPITGTDPVSGLTVFQNDFRVFWNDPPTGNLMRFDGAVAAVPAGSFMGAIQLTAPQATSAIAAAGGNQRRIAHNVAGYNVTVEPTTGGQVYAISLSLLQDLAGTQRKAQADIVRKVFLRNH